MKTVFVVINAQNLGKHFLTYLLHQKIEQLWNIFWAKRDNSDVFALYLDVRPGHMVLSMPFIPSKTSFPDYLIHFIMLRLNLDRVPILCWLFLNNFTYILKLNYLF